jgi:hypothetical protein
LCEHASYFDVPVAGGCSPGFPDGSRGIHSRSAAWLSCWPPTHRTSGRPRLPEGKHLLDKSRPIGYY